MRGQLPDLVMPATLYYWGSGTSTGSRAVSCTARRRFGTSGSASPMMQCLMGPLVTCGLGDASRPSPCTRVMGLCP